MGVIEKTRELAMEIAVSSEYKRLRETELVVDRDEKAGELKRQFAAQIERIQHLIESEAPSGDIQGEHEQLRAIGMEMDANASISEYRAARAAFDRLIEQVNGVIGHFLSGESLGKSCGGCGGCGKLN